MSVPSPFGPLKHGVFPRKRPTAQPCAHVSGGGRSGKARFFCKYERLRSPHAQNGRIYAFVLTAEGFRREFVNGLSGDKLALPVIRKEVSIWQEEGRGALSSSTTVRCICARRSITGPTFLWRCQRYCC